MDKKILITGSEGFIGGNLVKHCIKNNIEYFAPKFQELDISDPFSVANYLKDKKITHCIHSATTLRTGTDYPDHVLKNNLKMFFNLETLLPDDVKLINFGSGSEYNRQNWIPKMEEKYFGIFIPDDDHSYAKYLISKYISNSNNRRDMVTFRIFGIYGEGEDYRFKFISNLIAKVIHNIDPIINQNAYYDYIDVIDFCKICFELIFREKTFLFDSINVCSGNVQSLESFAIKVIKLSKKKNINYSIIDKNLGREYSGSNKRLIEILGYEPKLNNTDETIKRLYNYYQKNENKLSKKDLINDSYLNYAKKIMKKK
tara:strand:- start:4587 stop:5528 length:942 start_codon:yes stop_codon:yes gene_type:complete